MFMQNGSVSASHSPILYLLDTLLRQVSPNFHSEVWKSLYVQSFQKTEVCEGWSSEAIKLFASGCFMLCSPGAGRDFGMRLPDLTFPLSHKAAILAYGPPEHSE